MSLIVTLFVVALVTQGWTAPHRRNWSPQAILYLKGARGHRSVLERSSIESVDTSHLVSHISHQNSDGLAWASTILLKLLQQDEDEGEQLLDNYPEAQELTLTYL